jgi:hypothetical protein
MLTSRLLVDTMFRAIETLMLKSLFLLNKTKHNTTQHRIKNNSVHKRRKETLQKRVLFQRLNTERKKKKKSYSGKRFYTEEEEDFLTWLKRSKIFESTNF